MTALAFLLGLAILVLAVVILVRLNEVHDTMARFTRELGRIAALVEGARAKPGSPPSPPPLPVSPPTPVSDTPVAEAPRPAATAASIRPATQPLEPRKVPPPPRAVVPPAPPSRAMEEAGAILKRIWNWILVGEEHRSGTVPVEFAVAGTWLMRVGVIVLVFAVGWFLRWTIAHGVLGPAGRVALSGVAGAGLLAAGHFLGRRNGYVALGQGLAGGGFAAFYFAGYAACMMYGLIGPAAGFGVMIAVTLGAFAYAVAASSLSTAILGTLGGYLTPVVLSTNEPKLALLYAYLFLLGSGVLAVALWREWRILHYLSFAGAWVLFALSLRDPYDHGIPGHTVAALLFLAGLHLQHNAMAYAYAFRRRIATSLLEASYLTVNASFTAMAGYGLIAEAFGSRWVAAMALALAAINAAQIFLFLRRGLQDRNLLTVFMGLSGFFLAWSVPLLATGAGITAGWALMGLWWTWMGVRLESRLLSRAAFVLFTLAFIRILIPDSEWGLLAWEGSGRSYLAALWPRWIGIAFSIGPFFAARLLLSRGSGGSGLAGLRVAPEADLAWPPIPGMSAAVLWMGAVAAFVTANQEVAGAFGFYLPLRSAALTILWSVATAYLAARSHGGGREPWLPYAALAGLALTVAKTMLFDWKTWGFALSDFSFPATGVDLVARLAAHVVLLALLFVLAARWRPGDDAREFPVVARVAGWCVAFVYATIEIATVTSFHAPFLKAGAISLVWVLFATGLVGMGLRRDWAVSRYAGLALFAVVAGKIFLFDLSRLGMVWRTPAFLGVGLALIAGAWAYMRAGRKR